MNRPLCPILTIGFNPPEKGKPDVRKCTEECALFDNDYDCCALVAILEEIRETKPFLIYGEESPDDFYDTITES